jgi:hypothetical protein
VASWSVRQILANGIFDVEFAVLLQQKHQDCGELLCNRPDPELRVRIVGNVLFDVFLAVALVEENFIASSYQYNTHKSVVCCVYESAI